MDNIEFLNHNYFFLLLFIPFVLIYNNYKSFTNESFFYFPQFNLIPNSNFLKVFIKKSQIWVKILSLTLIIIALARPQSVKISDETLKKEGIDIIISIDVSSSMLAEDFKPNRLEAAKNVAIDFVSNRYNDRFGIVVYAGESYTQCPLTTDHTIVKNQLKIVKDGIIEDGTAIGMGLATSVSRLKESISKSKVIILLTDGENNTGFIDPITAVDLAIESNIKVYTIGVGSIGQAPYPTLDFFGRPTYVDVDVKIDEDLLIKIAEMTDGKYFRATDNNKLIEIYNENENLEKTEIEEIKYYNKDERFEIFALIALILLFISYSLKFTFLRGI